MLLAAVIKLLVSEARARRAERKMHEHRQTVPTDILTEAGYSRTLSGADRFPFAHS